MKEFALPSYAEQVTAATSSLFAAANAEEARRGDHQSSLSLSPSSAAPFPRTSKMISDEAIKHQEV